MDPHHWCPDADTSNHRFTFALVTARIVRNISGCAAHIKPDDIFDAGLRSGLGHPDNAARRTGQHRIFAAETVAAGQPTIRLHEQCQDVTLSVSFQLLDIFPQHG